MVDWGLPSDDVDYVLRDAISMITLRPRQVLFKQDSPVNRIYLLKTGALFQDRLSDAEDGVSRIVLRREVKPGQLLGHLDLLFGAQHATRARALDYCEVIAVDATALNRLLYLYPDLRTTIAPLSAIGRLRTVPFFEHLDTTVIGMLAEMAERLQVGEGDQVYAAEDPATCIYVIDQGQIRLNAEDRRSTWLANGMSFGLLDQPQDDRIHLTQAHYGHTATTLGATTLFKFSREELIGLTGVNPEEIGHHLRLAREQTIEALPVFSKFSHADKALLSGYMSHYSFPSQHVIMQQGEIGDSLWVLMPGSAGTLRALYGSSAMQPTMVYGPNYFNEMALRIDHHLDSTVQAEPGSQWLRLHKDDFQRFLQDTNPGLFDQLHVSPMRARGLEMEEPHKRFSWLQQTERLIAFQRRHTVALAHRLAVSIFMLLLFAVTTAGLVNAGLASRWTLVVFGALGLIVIIRLVWRLLDYLNDYIVVTNHRVVHQERLIFVSERRKAASLEQVRNIDVMTTFFGRLFNYGTINVQTAATDGSILFDFVTHPHRLKQTILEQQTRRMQHYQASSKLVIQNLLQERLGIRLRFPARVRSATSDAQSNELTRRDRAVAFVRALRTRRTSQLESRERVVWRKHWFVLTGRNLIPVAILILIAALFGGQQYVPSSWAGALPAADTALAVVATIMVLWIAWNFADWRNDTYEVDYRQIADVEKKPLFFAENRRTGLLSEIENIEVSIPSPIHYLFNFGNVRIQTAATHGEFSFDWVGNPRAVGQEIRRRIETSRQRQEDARARQRAEELPDWFEMYDRLGAGLQRGAVSG